MHKAYIPQPPAPKTGQSTNLKSPNREREAAVRHMLQLRAAGIYRRLLRQRLNEGSLSNSRANIEVLSADEQQAWLTQDVDRLVDQLNPDNRDDRLKVPTDRDLFEVASKLVEQTVPARGDLHIPRAPATARRSDEQRLPVLVPRATTPRSKGNAAEDVAAKPLILPPATDAPITTQRARGYLAGLSGAQPNDALLLAEIARDEEREKRRNESKGLRERMQADLWAQLSAFDSAEFIEEQRQRAQRKCQGRDEFRRHLDEQIGSKSQARREQKELDRSDAEKLEGIRQAKEALREHIEDLRKAKHEAEKVELVAQMRESMLHKRKEELRAKILDHRTKRLAEQQLADEQRRLRAKKIEQKRVAKEATEQNALLRQVHEQARQAERDNDTRLVQEAIRTSERMEAKRAERQAQIQEKIRRLTHLGEKLHESLEEQMALDAAKAERELTEINAKKEKELEMKLQQRKAARRSLQTTLAKQIEEREQLQQSERLADVKLKEVIAQKEAEMAELAEAERQRRKAAVERNRLEMRRQIEEKRQREAIDAACNMTAVEMAFNRKKLEAMSVSRERDRSERPPISVAIPA